MLQELDIKGGADLLLDGGSLRRKRAQGILGKRALADSTLLPYCQRIPQARYDNVYDIQDYVSETGYLPQRLITKGLMHIERSLKTDKGLDYKVMKQPRDRFMIDKRLHGAADDYFKTVMQPRLRLLDSERMALDQLKVAMGISGGTRQIPMTNEASDRIYQMVEAGRDQAKMLQGSYNPDEAANQTSLEEASTVNVARGDQYGPGEGDPAMSLIRFNGYDPKPADDNEDENDFNRFFRDDGPYRYT